MKFTRKTFITSFFVLGLMVTGVQNASAADPCYDLALTILHNWRNALEVLPEEQEHPGQWGHRTSLASMLTSAINRLEDDKPKNDVQAANVVQAYMSRIEANYDHWIEIGEDPDFALERAGIAVDVILDCQD